MIAWTRGDEDKSRIKVVTEVMLWIYSCPFKQHGFKLCEPNYKGFFFNE